MNPRHTLRPEACHCVGGEITRGDLRLKPTVSFLDWNGATPGRSSSATRPTIPMCTNELGRVGQLSDEADKRNTKVIGLSVYSMQDHNS